MVDEESADALPKGIKKEVVTAATDPKGRLPKKGDECSVHYIGRFYTADGEEFDNSYQRGKPVSFTLGVGQVVEGWDLAVATMQKGEVSRFTCAPEYAYGEQGAPPKIPGGITLTFEIELLSFVSEDDLFGDEGVTRTKVTKGTGWKEPEVGAEVVCSVKAIAADGRVLDERSNLTYILGSGELGPISKAVDKALEDMRAGGEVSLRCSKEYAYGDDSHGDVTVNVSLIDVAEIDDCSEDKDKSILKRQLKEGDGCAKPREGGSVRMIVEQVTDASGKALIVVDDPEDPPVLEFVIGNGMACEAIERGAQKMLESERAIITCTRPTLCCEPKLGLDFSDDSAGTITFTVEIAEMENEKATWEMCPEEKLSWAAFRKDVGGYLFKEQKFKHALERYKYVLDMLRQNANLPEGADELMAICELNKAMCLLKLGDNFGAKSACTSVLVRDPQNVKALFRRATAYLALHEYSEAVVDLRTLLRVDPENKEALRLLPQARAGEKEENKRASSMFKNMNKAFSGLADEEVKRVKEKKEAHEASIAKKGAEAKAEAKKWREGRGKEMSPEEAKEDMMRASQQMADMQKKIREMEMKKWMADAGMDVEE